MRVADDALAGLAVSRETRDRLALLVAELERWQRVHNLVAPSTIADAWRRHIADSLQLLPLASPWSHWVDLGSGAGFPGLVVAIACAPHQRVTLVESDGRKCAFLREAIRLTQARAEVEQSRIEQVLPRLPRPDLVSARALAPLARLLDWTAPVLGNGAKALFPKGREAQSELTEARRRWTFTADLIPSRTDSAARIVRITSFSGPAAP